MWHSETTTQACIDGYFGNENGDGYVRILDKPRPEGGKLVMRHRWFWELSNGPIPDGYEINHKCGNRRCFNLYHLELLEEKQHAVVTNKNRYREIINIGILMLHDGKSCHEVAEKLGRTVSCVQSWKRKYPHASIH